MDHPSHPQISMSTANDSRTIHAGVLLRFVPLTAKRLTGIAGPSVGGGELMVILTVVVVKIVVRKVLVVIRPGVVSHSLGHGS